MGIDWKTALGSMGNSTEEILARRQMEQGQLLNLLKIQDGLDTSKMNREGLADQRAALAADREVMTAARLQDMAKQLGTELAPGQDISNRPDALAALPDHQKTVTPGLTATQIGGGMSLPGGETPVENVDTKKQTTGPTKTTYTGTPAQIELQRRQVATEAMAARLEASEKPEFKDAAAALRAGAKIDDVYKMLQPASAFVVDPETGEMTKVGNMHKGDRVITKPAASTAAGMGFEPGPARDAAVRTYIQFGRLPPLGRGGIGSPAGRDFMLAVGEELTKQAANGNDVSNLGANEAINKTVASTLSKARSTYTMVNTSANIADKNLELAMQASPNVTRTDSHWINEKMQGFLKGASSQPGLTDFEVKIYTAAREYAKVSTGSSASVAELSAEATKQVQALLNAAQAPETFAAAVGAMRDDMGSILSSNNETIGALEAQLKNVNKPAAGAKPAEAPAGKNGDRKALPNGKQAELFNGRWYEVKQ